LNDIVSPYNLFVVLAGKLRIYCCYFKNNRAENFFPVVNFIRAIFCTVVMGRKKHIKIDQVYQFRNVFRFGDENLAGNISSFFYSSGNYTLELGCGHGDYSIELGALNPGRNFVGVDIKPARIFTASSRVSELNLKNVAFLIGNADKLNKVFPESSVDEIYIPFPDPHYKRKKVPRRLISKKFLQVFKSILIKDGEVHLKTDNEMIYRYALKTIADFGCKVFHSVEDLYSGAGEQIPNEVITKYERHYLTEGRKIKYICFGF